MEAISVGIVTDVLIGIWPDLSFVILQGFLVPADLAGAPIKAEHFRLCACLYRYQYIPSCFSKATDFEGNYSRDPNSISR
jgi:hypothetical protein